MKSLDQLAGVCGIQDRVANLGDGDHLVKEETKRRVLEAMGLDAGDEPRAASSLARLLREQWTRSLPFVKVLYESSEALVIPVVFPKGTKQFRWTLIHENKQQCMYQDDFSKLEIIEELDACESYLEARELILPHGMEPGYHRLRIDSTGDEMSPIFTPGRCWLPDSPTDGHRMWGLSVQVYLLRSERNWGIGDFTDLKDLVQLAKRQGADIVGVNPLHAMFLDKPGEASPYSPSDRLLLNVLNIDVQKVPGFDDSVQAQRLFSSVLFRQELEHCRDSGLVDYEVVARLKLAMLKLLYGDFKAGEEPLAATDFRRFYEERRSLLDRACTFQAIRLHLKETGCDDFNCWPEQYRDLESPGTTSFVQQHGEQVEFQIWLQWLADRQLRVVQQAAAEMEIGLYRDLAVGSHSSGAEVWSYPGLFSAAAHVGSPPDSGNPLGQDWGLPPMNPRALIQREYRPFIDLIRNNMRYSGALRIDHVMALKRLYWIPKGLSAEDGAYVEYPIEDMIGILALESQRNRCVVIGEDLGGVPEGFRERMGDANVLSYRVLSFEQTENGFVPPHNYPKLSLSVAGNHDLPTLLGWWRECDIDLREKLGMFADEEDVRKAREARSRDRESLYSSFQKQGLIGDERLEDHQLTRLAHNYLRRTNSLLTLLQLDDLVNETEQVNVPGTSSGNANWRRKLSVSLEQLTADLRLDSLAKSIREHVAVLSCSN